MTNLNYYLKRPGGPRKTFSIYSQVVSQDGSTKNQTLENKDVEAINKQLLAGSITLEHAERLVQSVKAKLANNQPEVYNSDNDKLLDTMLKQYFSDKPFLVSNDSAANKYKRAVRCLGPLSIMTVTRDEALATILKLDTNNQQREAAHKLNSLFRRLGRPIVIPVVPKEHDEVVHISEQEVEALITAADPQLAAYIGLAFYAGMRFGEIMALSPNSLLDKNSISVVAQIDRLNARRPPKNRKKRKAYLHAKGLQSFKTWVAETARPSHKTMHESFKRLTYKVLERSDLSMHDLRHSYAIYMLSAGIPIQLVAQSLGNSVRVCEDSYSGYVLSNQGFETINRILG